MGQTRTHSKIKSVVCLFCEHGCWVPDRTSGSEASSSADDFFAGIVKFPFQSGLPYMGVVSFSVCEFAFFCYRIHDELL